MIRRFPGEDARITELKDYAERHPAFRTDENIGDDTFFDRYPYRDEEDGGTGIRHNGEIRDRHIEEPRRSPNTPPNIAEEDID